MKSSRWIGIGSLALCAVASTVGCASEHGAQKSEAAAPSEAEMMANWTAFMTPGPEHKVLDFKVGKWKTQVKWWMDETTPPAESEGSAEIQWILGGRYLSEDDNGSVMGMPFQGMGVSGYDNLKKKYVSGWIDNMGTGIMTSEGTYDAAKQTFSYKTSGPDLMASKYVPMRAVETIVDANTFKVEAFAPDVKGKEYRSMEIVYTRTK